MGTLLKTGAGMGLAWRDSFVTVNRKETLRKLGPHTPHMVETVITRLEK